MPFILFLISIGFRNVMQIYLTCGKVKGKVFATSGTISFYLCYLLVLYFAAIHLIRHPEHDFYFISGFLILWSGISMRLAGLKQLGKYYSSFIELRKSQKLVTGGLFSIIRHPLHFSILMEIIGMGIISTNFLSLLPITGAFITIILRNRNEEKILQEHFGKEYEAYCRTVPSMNIVRGLIKKLKKW